MPFFKFSPGNGKTDPEIRPVQIRAFRLDKTPGTNAQFLQFVRNNSQWRRSQAKGVFVDRSYLAKWRGDLAPPQGEAHAPVTNVSWFAAQTFFAKRAACACRRRTSGNMRWPTRGASLAGLVRAAKFAAPCRRGTRRGKWLRHLRHGGTRLGMDAGFRQHGVGDRTAQHRQQG